MRTVHGRKASDHTAHDTYGFWCKKTAPAPGVQPHPINRVPYDLHEPHFVIAAISVPGAAHHGVVFQASRAEEAHAAEILLQGNQPQARWRDAKGQEVVLSSAMRLAPDMPAVIALTSEPGAQTLRVNSGVADRGAASLAPSVLAQFLIGWGFVSHYPRAGFGGHVYSVVTGRGVPTPQEMEVLERYLAWTAGLNPRRWPRPQAV
jgi:hypothetical protein